MGTNLASKNFTIPTILNIDAGSGVAPTLWDVVMDSPASGQFQIISSTVNQVLPSNFTSNFAYAGDPYVKLDAVAAAGRVTSVTLTVNGTPVSAPSVNEGAPSTTFSALVGVFISGQFRKTCVPAGFLAVPTVSFTADRNPPVLGLSNTINWWTWAITQ